MKIILLPLIRLLSVILCSISWFSFYIFVFVICFIWDFSIVQYKDVFKEDDRWIFDRLPRYDNNPIDTLNRYWNFDYY